MLVRMWRKGTPLTLLVGMQTGVATLENSMAMEYYSAIRKNDYPTFAATWTGLEEIMLREISQTEKDNYQIVSLICGT